jgi:hypothetical protein
MKRHVDGMGHLYSAGRVPCIIVYVFGYPTVQLAFERSAWIV